MTISPIQKLTFQIWFTKFDTLHSINFGIPYLGYEYYLLANLHNYWAAGYTPAEAFELEFGMVKDLYLG